MSESRSPSLSKSESASESASVEYSKYWDTLIRQRHPQSEVQSVIKRTADGTGGKVVIPAKAGHHIYIHGYHLRAFATAMNVRLVSNPGAATEKYLTVPEYLAVDENINRPWDYPGIKGPMGASVGIRCSVAGELYVHLRTIYWPV